MQSLWVQFLTETVRVESLECINLKVFPLSQNILNNFCLFVSVYYRFD